MYHFLQDSAFLPSNIANVAMLWGIYFWIAGVPASAGMCLGIAGVFHINHALAGIGLWTGASVLLTPSPGTPGEGRGEGSSSSISNRKSEISEALTLTLSRSTGRGKNTGRHWIIGTVALLALSAMQIVPALRVVLSRTGKLPLNEFVDLFVRVRHPHHFDPRAWHWGVWLSFLVPVAAVYGLRMRTEPRTSERRRAWVLFAVFMAMTGLALGGAGFVYASETLVQLNLYRFTIYPKLLGCVALAWLLWNRPGAPRSAVFRTIFGLATAACPLAWMSTSPFGWAPLKSWSEAARHDVRVGWLFLLLAVASIAVMVPVPWRLARWPLLAMALFAVAFLLNTGTNLGVRVAGLEGDDSDYRAAAEWARRNTPVDAVFVVPPDEESFRLHGRRAIVVNFKGVPQLSGELPEWRDRMLAVLDLKSTADLLALPRPMGRTLRAIRARYDALPAAHGFEVATKYGARYVLLTKPAEPVPSGASLVFDNGRYFLYDRGATPEGETWP
jgi:hypothetical protein